MKKNLLVFFAIYIMQLLVISVAFAQPWAEAMFPERRHSFGNVALGSESVYRFQFKNPYSDDVHIASVRSSCACTTPYWPKTAIKFGETAEIVAKLNTDGQFTGDRKATLTVVIDRPSRAEVQLQVTGYIRPDVVISPGIAEFGVVSEGTNVQKVLTLQYAGRSNWKLTGVECSNPHIQVDADPVKRNDERIDYKIVVTILKTMPSGYVHDMVRFTTNDSNSVIMFPVYGYVTSPLVAKPSPFIIGYVQPGEMVKKNLVFRSDVPFRITKITSKDRRFQFALSNDKNNSIHVLPVTFTADSSLGVLNEPIIIHTTLAGQKQMQVLTQGMVYDASLLDDHPGRLKHHLAEQSLRPMLPENSPPAIQESQNITALSQGESRMQIRLMPTDNAVQGASPQKTTNTIAFNMNTAEKQSEEVAVVIGDAEDNSPATGDISVVRPEETNTITPDLKIVSRLAPGEAAMSLEPPDTISPAPMVVEQKQDDLLLPHQTFELHAAPIMVLDDMPPKSEQSEPSIPKSIGDQQHVSDLMEVPFIAVAEQVTDQGAERANNGLPTPAKTTFPSQTADEQLSAGFEAVTEDSPMQSQAVPPHVNAKTDHRPELAVDPLTAEQTFGNSSQASSLPLKFSSPSVKANLETFTKPKPQQIGDSNAFAIVADSHNAVPGNEKSVPADTTLKETGIRNEMRIVSEAPPAKIPPVPQMKPTQAPVAPPFLPTVVAPEHEIIEPTETSPQISNHASDHLSPTPLPGAMNASPDLDSNSIAEMFGGSKISSPASNTANSSVAQTLPQAPVLNKNIGNPNEQDGLKPMELQPLQSGNPEALNARLLTIAPIPDEDLEYDEWSEADSDMGQSDAILPLFEKNPRLTATNNNREQLALDDDLPKNMPGNLLSLGQEQYGSADVVNGAPIPNRMIPNTMPNMSAQRIPQPPGNIPQRPGTVPQRPGVQQPPGNSQHVAQMQTAQPQLTPQQMQRVQQMQEMQKIQMQQRLAVAGQQAGRPASAIPPQNRIAQTNPRSPQPQPLVVPPAPAVPMTPMTPAPMFR